MLSMLDETVLGMGDLMRLLNDQRECAEVKLGILRQGRLRQRHISTVERM